MTARNSRPLAIEERDGALAGFRFPFQISDFFREELVRLFADGVGGAVVDPERVGGSADIKAEIFPGKRVLCFTVLAIKDSRRSPFTSSSSG